MARTRQTQVSKLAAKRKEPQTLAEMLFYFPDPDKRKELEEYRIEYEETHGPCDLSRRYTSMWPTNQQEWLMTHNMKRYFDGLPPFVKAYFKGKMETAASKGCLDNKPGELIKLFVAGQMQLDDGPDR